MDETMRLEWEAWQVFCQEFTTLTGIDINKAACNPMVDAVRLWGERLAALRFAQPTDRKKALAEAAQQYRWTREAIMGRPVAKL